MVGRGQVIQNKSPLAIFLGSARQSNQCSLIPASECQFVVFLLNSIAEKVKMLSPRLGDTNPKRLPLRQERIWISRSLLAPANPFWTTPISSEKPESNCLPLIFAYTFLCLVAGANIQVFRRMSREAESAREVRIRLSLHLCFPK